MSRVALEILVVLAVPGGIALAGVIYLWRRMKRP